MSEQRYEGERYLFKIEAYELTFTADIEKNYNKVMDKMGNAISEMGEEGDLSSICTSLGDLSQSFMNVVVNKDIADIGEVKEVFYLPMPGNLDENYEQSFDNSKLNVLYDTAKYVVGGTLKEAVNWAEETMERAGAIVDPNLIAVYKGSQPRRISCRWRLIPRNESDYKYIKQTVTSIAELSSAKREQINMFETDIPVHYLQQDRLFRISIISVEDELREIKMSQLLGGTLGDGFFISDFMCDLDTRDSVFRYDGSPGIINLSLTFVERKPRWADDWENYIEKVVN